MNLVRPPTVIPLLVRVSRTPTGTHLEIGGEVDLRNSSALRDELSGIRLDDGDPVHLDLGDLTFCDSEGARVLLRFLRRAHLAGHTCTVHGAGSLVHKVLVILGDEDLTFE
jgi:anti-anti-sigma factor